MKMVAARELSTIAMVNGNENKYGIVIDGDVVKQWVAIGWIELHMATAEDKEKYPHVLRS